MLQFHMSLRTTRASTTAALEADCMSPRFSRWMLGLLMNSVISYTSACQDSFMYVRVQGIQINKSKGHRSAKALLNRVDSEAVLTHTAHLEMRFPDWR